MKISIIGFGNMAKSFALGLLRDSNNQLQVASPSLPIGINEQGIHTHHDNRSIILNADVIILAVKPFHMEAVLNEIRPLLLPHQLVISIAAGLTFEWFSKRLPAKTPLIRSIPNLASAYGQSATPLIANPEVTDTQRELAERLFLATGIIAWAKHEHELDAFTALSGSGPAYFFLFMNSMVTAGVQLGLSEEIATAFAIQTAQGAVNLANTSDQSLLDLQKTVTSKGGTTAAAIQVFHEKDLNDIVCAAMKAACERSRALAKEFD